MLDHDQLTPAETQEQNQLLIQDLSRYYDTRAEDSASLARIRARLLQRAAGPLPLVDEGELTQPPLFLPARRARDTGIRLVHTFAKDRLRHPYLNALVAAMLLLALVGSFVVVLSLQQGTATPPKPLAVARGWNVVATFHGTGHRTIMGQDIELGRRYGWLLTCTNTADGWVGVIFNGDKKAAETITCGGTPLEPLAPNDSASATVAFAPIHTIEIVTSSSPPSISWELFLFKGIYHPPLKIDTANWHALSSEMDGTGSATWGGVDATLPKTWALEFVCYGTGSFKVDLESGNQPNVSEIAGYMAPCNGQTNFNVAYLVGQGMTVSQVQITTNASNDWQILLLGCTNNKPNCGITSQTPTPTP